MSSNFRTGATMRQLGRPARGRLCSRQTGVGMLGLIFVLAMIGASAALIISLVPHYITHYAIIEGLENMTRASLIKPKFKLYSEVKEKVFDLNSVYVDKPEKLMVSDI